MVAGLAQVALLVAGCERPAAPKRYVVQQGSVMTSNRETGELGVAVVRRMARSETRETLACVVTKDSEIYINDRFAAFNEINIGDVVELIGYRDPNPGSDKFVVTYAYVEEAGERRGSLTPP